MANIEDDAKEWKDAKGNTNANVPLGIQEKGHQIGRTRQLVSSNVMWMDHF